VPWGDGPAQLGGVRGAAQDVLLVDLDLRVSLGHRVGTRIPPWHADRDVVAFGGHGQVPARAAPPDLLMSLLSRSIADKRLLALIGRYLRAGVLVGEHIQLSEIGTPQGGPLSPLLANILLHQLDRELERRGHRFARYADDLVILVKSQRAGERVMRSITHDLQSTLKLSVDETPVAQAGAIRARVDWVLRHQPVLAAHPRTGRLDQAAHPMRC
jgi:hypothetical protein